MTRFIIAIIFVVTTSLLYAVLTYETDLEAFDLGELKALLGDPRPIIPAEPSIESQRQRFASQIMQYAKSENKRLEAARTFINAAINRQIKKSETDAVLIYLTKYFGVPANTSLDTIQHELMMRVDGLPPRLVATQAAIESAWGTSRFAVNGNNFFGHQCYSKGCGIKPKQSTNPNLEVRTFNSTGDAVAAYYQNINSHRAYTKLRTKRAELRVQRKEITVERLIPTLSAYSEQGAEYLKILKSVSRSDHIQLAAKAPQ